jgi:Protein of unknown function (DUF2612)/PASTA domain
MSLTWVSQPSLPVGQTFTNCATDPVHGITCFVSSFNSLYRTTDGCVTVNSVPGIPGSPTVGFIGFGGGNFVMSTDSGFYTSPDGLTWTGPAATSGGFNRHTKLAFSPTLGTSHGMWMAVVSTFFATSVDGGATWSAAASISSIQGISHPKMVWDGTEFIFESRDAANTVALLVYSSDGSTWATVNLGSIFGNNEPFDIEGVPGHYLLGMATSGPAQLRQTTTLAALATQPNTDVSSLLAGCNIVPAVFTPDGVLFVAAGEPPTSNNDGLIEQDSLTSSTWIASTSPLTTSNYVIFFDYDPVHQILIGLGTGTTGWLLTAGYIPGVIVPNVVGLSQVAATLAITSAGLTLGPISSTYSATIPPGLVALQVPTAGTHVAPGSPVAITLSLGSPGVVVPDVIGMTAAVAESTIAGAQLVTGAITGVLDPDIAIGSVGTQSPLPGTIVFAGTPVDLGISFIVPEFDVDATVISQYANSPTILALVANFAEYFDPAQNLQSFYLDVWNIDTAIGFGLDIWGRILGVSRVIPIPGTSGSFGFENSDTPPDWENFGNLDDVLSGGPFFSGQISGNSYKLNDGPYRTLLLTKALGNICATTAPALNALITNLFPGRGRCYTKDGGAMTMTYVFEFPLTTIEYAILAYSGVLAHPAGVGVNISVAAGGFFGFAEALPGVEPFNFGTFFGA